MVISYFNYLWDIDGISAGSAIKGREFVAGLRRMGHKVYLEWRVKQPEKTGVYSTAKVGGAAGMKQRLLREPKVLAKNFTFFAPEYKILQEQKPDIFFPRLEYGNFSNFLLADWLKIPMVVEADCPPTYEWKEFYAQDAFKLGNLSNHLEMKILQKADAVITQSNALSTYYIEQGIPESKITMIPNAADINKFVPRERDKAFEKKYNLAGKKVIGWVGAGIAWTGIEVILETAKKLLEKHDDVCFFIVGSNQIMELMGKHFEGTTYKDRVILAGLLPHEAVPIALSCMDIVLALYPPFDFFYASSMKVFEYMAAGKAIVATRIGQIAEVIEEGENGFLFDYSSQEELFKNIDALLENSELVKKFGINARKEAEREWNWDVVAQKMTRVFGDVLATRGKLKAAR